MERQTRERARAAGAGMIVRCDDGRGGLASVGDICDYSGLEGPDGQPLRVLLAECYGPIHAAQGRANWQYYIAEHTARRQPRGRNRYVAHPAPEVAGS